MNVLRRLAHESLLRRWVAGVPEYSRRRAHALVARRAGCVAGAFRALAAPSIDVVAHVARLARRAAAPRSAAGAARSGASGVGRRRPRPYLLDLTAI